MRLINYGLRFAYIRRSARTLCRAHRQVAQHAAQVDGRRLGFFARYNHRYALGNWWITLYSLNFQLKFLDYCRLWLSIRCVTVFAKWRQILSYKGQCTSRSRTWPLPNLWRSITLGVLWLSKLVEPVTPSPSFLYSTTWTSTVSLHLRQWRPCPTYNHAKLLISSPIMMIVVALISLSFTSFYERISLYPWTDYPSVT